MIHENMEFRKWRSIFWKLTSYEHHQVCYSSKNPDNSKILLVKRGTLLVQVSNHQDERVNMEILVEGDIVNIEALIEHTYVRGMPDFIQYQVVAFEDVELYEIEKEFFLSHLYVDPRKYHRLFEKVIMQLFDISFSNALANKNTQAKVAWALFRITQKAGQPLEEDENLVALPSFATQTFISQMSSSGKARTNEAIRELFELGVVNQRKGKLINLEALINYLRDGIIIDFSISNTKEAVKRK